METENTLYCIVTCEYFGDQYMYVLILDSFAITWYWYVYVLSNSEHERHNIVLFVAFWWIYNWSHRRKLRQDVITIIIIKFFWVWETTDRSLYKNSIRKLSIISKILWSMGNLSLANATYGAINQACIFFVIL